MAQKRFLITNFAYGIGTYLRTTEIALALNSELKKHGKDMTEESLKEWNLMIL